MDIYDLIRSAVLERRCLTAIYERRIRHFSPHCLGRNKLGGLSVLGFQYAGETNTSLPPQGQWRCFRLTNLSEVQVNADHWRTGEGHTSPSDCVKLVDVDAYLGGEGSGDRRPRKITR
jgi:hypothetical protein